MRPGDFSPGNPGNGKLWLKIMHASMRPGDFSPGNFYTVLAQRNDGSSASMRPGDFSPGNERGDLVHAPAVSASMRPGDFSPGNMLDAMTVFTAWVKLQ